MRRIATLLLLPALLMTLTIAAVGCGDKPPKNNGDADSGNANGANKNGKKDGGGNEEPVRSVTYTASLPEFPKETADETKFRNLYNTTVKSIGGEIPKDYRTDEALQKVMKDPAKWVEANETLQSARNTINRGRFLQMTDQPIESLNKLVGEAANALLTSPNGRRTVYPYIATDEGFKDNNTGKEYNDADKFPIMHKAMALVKQHKYLEALDCYSFGPNFPKELVKENDRDSYERKVFAAFRTNIVYAIVWDKIGADIEFEFERGTVHNAAEYVEAAYIERELGNDFIEIKSKTSDTQMDGHGKFMQVVNQLQQMVNRRIGETYMKLINQINSPIAAAISGGGVMTAEEIDALEKKADEVLNTIRRWRIESRTQEAEAFMGQWKESFAMLRKKLEKENDH